MSPADETTLPLLGIEGDNPLGFLALAGTMRVLSMAWPHRRPRVHWHPVGAWQPVLHVDGPTTPEDVASALFDALQGRHRAPEFDELGPDLVAPPSRFADFARRAAEAARPNERTWADFAAAFGTEIVDQDGNFADTALRTMSGAGHQHFLEFMVKLARPPAPEGSRAKDDTGTSADHIRRSLFEQWTRSDPKPSLRWDPEDDRRFALRAFDPTSASRSPIRTERGANRLAIESLPLFPTFAVAGRARTRAFAYHDRQPALTWPIWTVPIDLDGLKALLAHPELVTRLPRRDRLAPYGVAEIIRSRRISVGKYRNFTPGRALWGAAEAFAPAN